MKRIYLLALLLASSAALAQDIPNHSVPIGGGPGVVGWRSAGPCVVGQTLIYSGTSSDPGCSAIVTTGGSGILSATLAVNPLGTTSTTFVMGGVGSGCRITPNSTGRVLVILTGTISNSANGVLTSVGLRIGTGTAPVNGAAATGTSIGNPAYTQPNASTTNVFYTVPLIGIATGLVSGTSYWLDYNIVTSNVAGTAVFQNVVCTAIEL